MKKPNYHALDGRILAHTERMTMFKVVDDNLFPYTDLQIAHNDLPQWFGLAEIAEQNEMYGFEDGEFLQWLLQNNLIAQKGDQFERLCYDFGIAPSMDEIEN